MNGRVERPSSAAEVAERLAADRRAQPYLLLRDAHGAQRIVDLGAGVRLTIGRLPGNDLIIDWDPEVSRTHAQLELIGVHWTLADDGLSRNGSFVNEERNSGRRRLTDGDVLRFGNTAVHFHSPGPAVAETAAGGARQVAQLTDSQRRVLVALCRPLAAKQTFSTPASNGEIAAELHLSVDGVRTHMRGLFECFAIPDLPQNRKRAELARRALASGVIAARDLVE